MKFKAFLEMPINFRQKGNWSDIQLNPYAGKDDTGYDKVAHGVFSNPKGLEKITQKMSNIPHDLDVYINVGNNYSTPRKIPIEQYKEPLNRSKINIIINTWGEEPPTAWMIMHRLGHMIQESIFPYSLEKLLSDLEDIGSLHIGKLMNDVLTTKSARTGKILSTMFFNREIERELFAQYMMTGRVRLNRVEIKNKYFTKDLTTEELKRGQKVFDSLIDKIEKDLNNMLEKIVSELKNFVYVW